MTILNSVPTVHGKKLYTSVLLGTKLTSPPNTTLNEKFNMGNNKEPIDGVPTLKYFVIGNGCAAVGNPSTGKFVNSSHDPLSAALYNHTPVMAKPITSRLTIKEREKYRLRVETTLNGVAYELYYAKLLEVNSLVHTSLVALTARTIKRYSYNDDKLMNPINTGAIPKGDKYIQVSNDVKLILTIDELKKIKNSIKIIAAHENNSVPVYNINEMAICTGVDKDMSVGGTKFKEANNVTIYQFLNTDVLISDVINNNQSIVQTLGIGGSDLMRTR